MPAQRPVTTSSTLRLQFGDVSVEAHVTVPAAPVEPAAMLPALYGIVNDVVATGERRETAAGHTISCRKGCGACCRQLVPVSPVEAQAIRRLVGSLPEARAREVRARFAAIERRLEQANMVSPLSDPAARGGTTDRSLSVRYFALGMPCPFLENESCSIHPQRPLACREYLVTSPAAHCSDPEQSGVVPVAIPKLSVAARGLDVDDQERDTSTRWVPLSLALADGRQPKQTLRRRTGPDWIRQFLTRLRISSPKETS